MPPTSNIRKTSTTTTTFASQPDANAVHTRRTMSGRAVRANTTRPANYYARPFASAGNNGLENDEQEAAPPGFFPAITFFTDAITALPKEVQRQFTLMKEVEAKIFGNQEKLADAVDELMTLPVPPLNSRDQVRPRAEVENGGVVGQGVLSLTANNSVFGSTAPSLINGVAPNAPGQISAQNSVAGSWAGEEAAGQAASEDDLAKRQKYHEMRSLIANMLPNLDEKGVVLSEANRILARQHMRIDSVKPYLDDEISEEARLGSMTHWAYSDNRQRKNVATTNASRRDVAATNNLAAAANAIHESEIAAARSGAGREGREKHKGRHKEQIDSDFDDRPIKKAQAKVAKKQLAAPAAGLGISANGEPVKRRKVDKGLAASGMERTISTKGAKALPSKEAARSTPGAEAAKKTKTKPAPLPVKRKGLLSANASPALASSPLHSSFTGPGMEPPGAARPQSARMRQSSNATNLRHEKLASDEGSRPTSAPGKSNGERKRKAPLENAEEAEAKKTTETSDTFARDDADLPNSHQRAATSRSGSNSGKAGRGSAVGTPRTENFPDGAGPAALLRSRSGRSLRGNREDESSSEPQVQGSGRQHKRQQSNSHLVKQLASFNRSPDMDRDHDDELDDELDSGAERRRAERRERGEEGDSRSPRKRRPGSRRNTLQQGTSGVGESSPQLGEADGDTTMVDLPANDDDRASDHSQQGKEAVGTDLGPTDPPTAPSSPAHLDRDNDAEMNEDRFADYDANLTRGRDQEALADDEDAADDRYLDELYGNEGAGADNSEGEEIDQGAAGSELGEEEVDEDEEDEEEGDPDDPNEPKYCYCNRGSYGEMIACDNEDCPREWFHFECTGLKEPPEEEEKWYCRDCAPLFVPSGRGKGRNGRGRGRGG